MDPWSEFEQATRLRHGVADVALARAHGVAPARFYDRTQREDWPAPTPGTRVHPAVTPSVQQSLVIACLATRTAAGASRQTALWLHGLVDRPPNRPTIAVHHAATAPRYGKVVAHRARWVVPTDVVEVNAVPTLDLPATFVSMCGARVRDQRRRLIDALHRDLTTIDAVLARLEPIGPLPGQRQFVELCQDLADRRVESIFQEEVVDELTRLGYRPERSTRRIDTPDGRGLEVDVPLPAWKVAVEPEGDAFHRGREARRLDRRRLAAYAGTAWVPVPIDWRDWLLEPDRVLATVAAAIAAQRARGIGADVPPPGLAA
jgi:hypothetical protein